MVKKSIVISDMYTTTTKTQTVTSGTGTAITNITSSPVTMNTQSSGITLAFTTSNMILLNTTSSTGRTSAEITSDMQRLSISSTVHLGSSKNISITTLIKYVESGVSSTVSPTLSFSSGSLPSYSTTITPSSVTVSSALAVSSSEIHLFNTTTIAAISSTSTNITYSYDIPTGKMFGHMRVMGVRVTLLFNLL